MSTANFTSRPTIMRLSSSLVVSLMSTVPIYLPLRTNKLGFLQKKDARKKVLDLSGKYGLKVDPDALVEDITVGMQQRIPAPFSPSRA